MAEVGEPKFDLAQLAHVEIFTPKVEETLWFFKELLGLEETGAERRVGLPSGLRGFLPP